LTVPTRQGNVIIAFLALFVAYTGTHLWKIVCFAFHQIQSNYAPQDGMYHQIQAILPTGLSDVTMLWRFGRISWAWRGKTRRVWPRAALLIGTCLVHFVAISIAGLFSSRVTDSTDQVLINASNNCGWYDLSPASEQGPKGNLTNGYVSSMDSLAVTGRTSVLQAQQYARLCYDWIDGSTADTSLAACSSYVVSSIPSTINRTAACPFSPDACSGPAISFDSGWIDSNTHLGINARLEDRIQLRRNMTCAPVPFEQRYSLPWTDMVDPFSRDHRTFQYKMFQLGSTLNDLSIGNFTFGISNETLLYATPYNPG
jgi:hypothetical protein